MKERLTIALLYAVALILCTPEIKADYIGYSFDDETMTAKVAYVHYTHEGDTIVIPEKLEHDGHEYTITALEENAFKYQRPYSTEQKPRYYVILPPSITEIGDGCFDNNKKLVLITDLSETNLETIGARAFYSCDSLTSLSFPPTLKSVGWYAFHGCSSLSSVKFADIENGDESGNGTGVVEIGEEAFEDCSSLTRIDLGNTVKTIGKRAFEDCSSLTRIDLGNTVKMIGHGAFKSCKLEEIVWGPPGMSVEDYAFNDNPNLSKIHIKSHKAWFHTNFEHTNSIFNFGQEFSLFLNGQELTAENFSFDSQVDSIGYQTVCRIQGMTTATSLSIPPTVSWVASDAFLGCSEMRNLTFEDGPDPLVFESNVKTPLLEIVHLGRNLVSGSFSSNKTLTNITFGSAVKSIPKYFLSGCTALRSITIPGSVTFVGDCAFSSCSSLNSVNIEDSETPLTIESSTLSSGISSTFSSAPVQSLYLGRNIEYMSTQLSPFKNITTLIDLTIGNKVTAINDYLFYGCQNITNMAIPSSVKSVGDYSFYDCCNSGLLVISSSVKSIGEYAFYNCRNLKRISIPNSVTTVGDYAFRSCVGAKTISIGNKVTHIGDYAFLDCYGADEIKIGEAVEAIGANAFYNCNSLKAITIPNAVKTIGDNAFALCISASDASIGDNVETIGVRAFADCEGLESLSIGSSVDQIGYMAFFNCENIKNIECRPVEPPVADESVFSDYSATLKVPDASVNAYRRANGCWPLFVNITGGAGNSGIESAVVNPDSFVKVFNLRGMPVYEGRYSEANLHSGIYIVNGCKILVP